MQKMLKRCVSCLSLALVAVVMSGCANLQFPWVYRIVVQQGNIIEQKKVDQLELGMSKRQVQYIMGTPLVNDTFHDDRWDYIYQLQRGDELLRERRFTVYFENDQLVSYEGDYQPRSDEPVEDDYIEDGERAAG